MSDEAKLREDEVHGIRAQTILDSEEFDRAVSTVEKSLLDLWLISKSTEERERIWLSVNLVAKIKDALQMAAQDGRLAVLEIEKAMKG